MPFEANNVSDQLSTLGYRDGNQPAKGTPEVSYWLGEHIVCLVRGEKW